MKFTLRREPDDPAIALESKLVAECKAGNAESYEHFVKENQNKLYHVALQILRDESLAEEATQLTFIKGWRKIRSFRGNSRFGTWLHRLCVNTSWDLLRQRMREKGRLPSEQEGEAPKLLLDEILSKETPPDKAMIGNEIKSLVLQAMDKLPEEQRLVLVLREMQGLDYHEIAKTLGCREGTVMSRLFHARRKVRQLLEKII